MFGILSILYHWNGLLLYLPGDQFLLVLILSHDYDFSASSWYLFFLSSSILCVLKVLSWFTLTHKICLLIAHKSLSATTTILASVLILHFQLFFGHPYLRFFRNFKLNTTQADYPSYPTKEGKKHNSTHNWAAPHSLQDQKEFYSPLRSLKTCYKNSQFIVTSNPSHIPFPYIPSIFFVYHTLQNVSFTQTPH